MDNGSIGGGSKADAAAAAEAVAEAAAAAEEVAAAAGRKPELCFETSDTDISWQLAKDADGPDGKMKNTRKFGFSEYVLQTRNR